MGDPAGGVNRRTRDRRRVMRGGRRAGDRPGRHPAVLIVDPDETIRGLYVRYLERFNFDVRQAAALADTITPMATLPAVILSDASQPFDRYPDVLWPPIIALAPGSGKPTSFRPASLLVKPFRLADMLEAVRVVLRAPEAVPPAFDR